MGCCFSSFDDDDDDESTYGTTIETTTRMSENPLNKNKVYNTTAHDINGSSSKKKMAPSQVMTNKNLSSKMLSVSVENTKKLETLFKVKRDNIFTAGFQMDDCSTFVAQIIAKTSEQKDLIRSNLLDSFIFSGLKDEDMNILVDAVELKDFRAGESIIKQGDQGDYYYIVNSGTCSVFVDGKMQGSVARGKGFGELALLHDTPRAATVRSDGISTLFSLDRQTFRYVIAQNACSREDDIKSSLNKVSIFQNFTDNQLQKIADVVEVIHYKAGNCIFKKNADGNIFYMINKGTVKITGFDNNHTDTILEEGSYFGERALLVNEPRSASAYAETDTQLLAVDRESFTTLLGDLYNILVYNMNLRIITNIKLFENLSSQDKDSLSKAFVQEKFDANTVIIRQGDKGRKFYILYEGKANVLVDDKIVNELDSGSHFGEMALLDDEIRHATIIATMHCECFSIDRPSFNKIAGQLKDILERPKAKDQSFVATNIEFKNLKHLTILGAGTFGRVFLVQESATNSTYALKTLLKSEVVAQRQTKNVMNEKNVMMACNHPFVLRLFQTYKDSQKLYMLLEFVQGGELFCVLHTNKGDGVSELSAKFYSTGVILALAHLHSKNIAHRDLKPENCLIDNQGYPKLVDFGFAKVIQSKSFTLCGTPEYLAPELVLGRGHNMSVDYWAYGVLIFEMLAGYSPFHDPIGGDQVVICKNIVHGKCSFPKGFSDDAKDIIKKLLSREQCSRLGNLKGGYNDIVSHSWLTTVDTSMYMKKMFKAPWIPKISSKTDTSSFDYQGDDSHCDTKYIDDGSNWDAAF